MKLSKRFSLFKKSLGLTLAASCILACVSCNNMTNVPTPTMTATLSKTLTAPEFPVLTDENGTPVAVSSQYEQFYTVTQGQKKKISLSWNPVDVAKYYEIYYAADINDTFKKAGETTKTSFDDSVSPGKNYFYKVCAVNSKGERSDFSSIARGSTLATPAITSINVDDTSATIAWYMANAAVDTYAKKLIYELHASSGSDEKVVTIKGWNESASSLLNSYSFEGLAGNREYTFQVIAYTTSDQSQTESSPKVTQKTLAQYTPGTPDFTVSQGESVSCIKVRIKLPPKVMDEYPLCFEIERKKTGTESWRTVESCLYFDGHETPPTSYDDYKEGDWIEWEDPVGKGSNLVAQAIKYDYRVISVIDANYSTTYTGTSIRDNAHVATGWAADFPTFKAKRGTPEVNPVTNKNTSVPVTFEVTWNDLGKAQDYRFAIEQNRKKFDDDNGGTPDTVGEDSWVINENTTETLLESMDDVNALTKTYDFTSVPPALPGIYTYTLYIVPKKFTDPSKIKEAPLTTKEAPNKISISENATEPKNEITAEGGYKDHVILTWEVEGGVSYYIEWKKYKDGVVEALPDGTTTRTIQGQDLKDDQAQYTGKYNHEDLEGGCEYHYTLYANGNPGETKIVYTLGTPVLTFDANSYTDITVTWPQVVAADEGYIVKLGNKSTDPNPATFGDGIKFTVKQDGTINDEDKPEGVGVSASLDSTTKIISLTISKPYGWNDATLSGKAVPLTVTAQSELNRENDPKDTTHATKDVWTIGPAAADLKATETHALASNTVTITWKELEGAKGYAVYRLRPDMTGNTNTSGNLEKIDASLDVYYVFLEGGGAKVVCPSGAGNATPDYSGPVDVDGDGKADIPGTFTLTDIYKYAGAGADSTAQNQQLLALGIPFTYTIIPVLNDADVDTYISNPSEWKIAGQDGQIYSKLADVEKIGYTTGYGIALEASKADYPDRVVLTWERPQSAIDKSKKARIYYRAKGSSDSWTKLVELDDKTKETATIALGEPAEERTEVYLEKEKFTADEVLDYSLAAKPLEYAVTYGSAMNKTETGEIDAAYIDYQNGIKNLKITDKEAKCVGYMFTLPQIMPVKQKSLTENYKEQVTWSFYDYVEEGEEARAVGASDIKEYVLEIQNLNCSKAWLPLFTYYANTEGKTDGEMKSKGSKSWYDATITTDEPSEKQVTAYVEPKWSGDGGSTTNHHDGLLKVQRAYKHWYKISAKRTNSLGTTITATSLDYAYRKITEEERNKCVGLICADAFYQMGIPRATGWKNLQTIELGEMKIGHRSTVDHAYWGTGGKPYQHRFPRTPGNQNTDDDKNAYLTSGFIVAIADAEGGSCGGGLTDTSKLKSLPASTIAISHVCGLPSYTSTLSISEGFNGADWFPYDFGKKHENGDSTLNINLNTYKGKWWEVRQ